MIGPDRAALYAPQASAEALAACARYADQVGLRVVTIVDEDAPGATPLAGQGLNRLIGRLAAGEFEVVVADAGKGRFVTIAAAPPPDVPDDDAPDDEGGAAPAGDASAGDAPLRCAIYMRCATAEAPDPLAAQTEACRAYAAKHGWETVAVYSDVAVSGLKTSRAGLDQAMAQARQGAFDVLLIESLDRLGRDALHIQRLAEELDGLGVALHTAVAGSLSVIETAFRSLMMESSRRLHSARTRYGRREAARRKAAQEAAS